MPIILIAIGLVLIISGWRGTEGQLWTLLVDALFPKSAKNNFLVWAGAIFIIGLFGFIEKIRPLVIGFIVLIYIVMLISLNKTGSLSNIILNLNQFTVKTQSGEGQNILSNALKE